MNTSCPEPSTEQSIDRSTKRILGSPQKTAPLFPLGLCLALVALAVPAGRGAPADAALHILDNGAGFFEVKVDAPSNSAITLQIRSNLTTSAWTDYSAPAVVGAAHSVSFPVPNLEYFLGLPGPPQSYFRAKVESLPFRVDDDGTNVTFKTSVSVSIDLLLYTLAQASGVGIFPGPGYDPETRIGPIDSTAPNLPALLAAAGIDAWVLPPKADDPAVAARFLNRTNIQDNPLPRDPEDVGSGRNEDGFPGIPTLPVPPTAPADPPPSTSGENPLDPNAGPIPDGELQEPDPNAILAGRHLRLTLGVTAAGGVSISGAVEAPGDAMRSSAPSYLEHDAVVYVVKSTLTSTNPGSIYFIGDLYNPFEIRSVNPPGVGEVLTSSSSATLRIPIPVLATDRDLSGLTVEIHKVIGPVDGTPLTPVEFIRDPARFQLLGTLTGAEITRALRPPAPPMGAGGGGPPSATLTQVHGSGPKAQKFNLVFIGDGFSSSSVSQNNFNSYVDQVVMTDMLSRDIHPEILNALNVYRINTISTSSGITMVNSNGTVIGTDLKSALGTRYSGIWSRCWMESGTSDQGLSTEQTLQNYLDALIPEADAVAVVQNLVRGGGCAKSAYFIICRGSSVANDNWSTLAHEFGHFYGGLGDEYTCNASNPCYVYAGAEPSKVNLTASLSRSQVKWAAWIPPTRPIPTLGSSIADNSADVGIFPGATTGSKRYASGLNRPSNNGRMQSNANQHNPVGYGAIRTKSRSYQDPNLRRHVTGDFNGDGFTDVVTHDGVQLALFLAADRNLGPDDPVTGSPPRVASYVLAPTWVENKRFGNAAGTIFWRDAPHDILVAGDFNNDGMDDLYVINLEDWAHRYLCLLRSTGTNFVPVTIYKDQLPGYGSLGARDQFFASDFDNDGRKDLLIYTGTSWTLPYLGMMRSTGSGLVLARRYDDALPHWQMGRHEKLKVGDFNGDGRDDLFIWTADDWSKVHLRIYTSAGNALSLADRHYGAITLPGFTFTLRSLDQWHVLDHNGDGRSDLGLFNGLNWGTEYFVMFTNTVSGALATHRTYVDSFPGWDMGRRDEFTVVNVDGDGDDDLAVFNTKSWTKKYLGMIKSSASQQLVCTSVQDTKLGSWTFTQGDSVEAADFGGGSGWDDLFLFNSARFGLVRSLSSTYYLEADYPFWIRNERYQKQGYY